MEKGFEQFLSTPPQFIVLSVVWDGYRGIPRRCKNIVEVFYTKEELFEYILKCERFKVYVCGKEFFNEEIIREKATEYKKTKNENEERKQYEILKQKFEK